MRHVIVCLLFLVTTSGAHAYTIDFPAAPEPRMYTIRYGCTTDSFLNRYIHENITVAFIGMRGPTTRNLQPEGPCQIMLFHAIGSTLEKHRDRIVSTYGPLKPSESAFKFGQKVRSLVRCVVDNTIDLATASKSWCERKGGKLRSYYLVRTTAFSISLQHK